MSSEDQGSCTKSDCNRICYTWTLKLNALTDLWSKRVSQRFPDYRESIIQFYLETYFEGTSDENMIISLRTVCKSDYNKTKYVSISIENRERNRSKLLKLSEDWTINMGSHNTIAGYCPLANGTLTIHCEIILTSPIDKIMSIEVPKCKLLEDFAVLFDTKENSDVTIVSKDHHEIPAHKAILTARSKVFAAMFQHAMEESLGNSVTINDFDHDVLMELLRFLYTGEAPNLEDMAPNLLAAADKYGLDRLKAMCLISLCDNLSIETAAITLKLADLYRVEELRSNSIHFINKHAKSVANTTDWQKLIKTDKKLIFDAFFEPKILLNLDEEVKNET